MREFRAWYREALPARMGALEASREALERGEPEAAEAVLRIAHALRGSGATYGFPKITEAARALETAVPAERAAALRDLLRILKESHEAGASVRQSILVIEDDPDLARYAEGVLASPGRTIHVARSAAEARAILDENEISLILLDLVLPDSDGRNLLVEFRERLSTSVIPVVVATMKGGARVRAECLALGADGFLEKPFDLSSLRQAVEAGLGAGSGLAREIRKDPVTGLPNRAAFLESFERARYVAAASGEPLSLGLVDLRRLRAVGDVLGAFRADEVLRRAAERLAAAVPAPGMVARWNGDQFVALMPGATRRAAAQLLRRAQGAPAGSGPGGIPMPSGFSAGVAEVGAEQALEDVVGEAERFLLLARGFAEDRVISEEDRIDSPRRRALVVEDDELVRLVVQRLLEREGFEVDVAGDGVDALDRAKERPYSLVVSDIRMSRMDGLELLGRLRAMPQLAQTPVMLLTAMGSEEDVARGFERGADEYIVKPFAAAEVRSRVRRLLARGTS